MSAESKTGAEPVLAMIVAMASNRVIGKDNQLPWHLSEDLKFFKRTTMAKPIIMGRKTYESIGRPLPGRPNLVVSRNPEYRAEGIEVFADIESALARGRELAIAAEQGEVMMIGGANLYEATLPLAQRLYVTEVKRAVEGDAYFPVIPSSWKEVERNCGSDDAEWPFDFVRYERV